MGFFDRFRKKTDAPHSASPETTDSPEAIRLIDQGNALEEEGKLDEAMTLYQSAAKLCPGLARARLNLGNVHLARGETVEAIAAYRQAIELDDAYAAAYFNIGNAYVQVGDFDSAIASYRSAIDRKPDFTEAHVALGYVFDESGRFDEAIACHRHVLVSQPEYDEVRCNLATSLRNRGLPAEALDHYRGVFGRKPEFQPALQGYIQTSIELGQDETLITELRAAVERDPGSPQAHRNLAAALASLERFDEAIAAYRLALGKEGELPLSYYGIACCLQAQNKYEESAEYFRKAVDIDGAFFEARNELGNVLLKMDESEAAATIFRELAELHPQSSIAHSNLGNALQKLGRLQEAAESIRTAIRLQPDSAIAYGNLAGVLNLLGRLDLAIENYRRALELNPEHVQAHINLGITLWQVCRPIEATEAFETAIRLDPENIDAKINLGMGYATLGKLDQALEVLQDAIKSEPQHLTAQSTLIFLHNYLSDQTPEALLAEARRYGELVTRKATNRFDHWENSPLPERPLNIGFVSGDMWEHPVGFFLDNVIHALCKSPNLKLFAYSNSHTDDALTARLKSAFAGWRSLLGLPDKAAGELIRQDGIDILIDLSGHTLHNRMPMFAWRPAPVQVTWLGFFATTGVAEIEYLIADPWTLPESQERYFTEKIVRMPQTRLCFTPPKDDVVVGPPPAVANGFVTFGCFNNLTKLNDGVISLWARILKAVPGSKLCLMAGMFQEEENQRTWRQRFGEKGIDPDRLILKRGVPRKQYLEAYNDIDIALDPFPYTGGTTTAEALWMGVPVLTLAGHRFLSRQGVGLLANTGLQDWIANSEEEYFEKAVAFAGALDRRTELRARQRAQVLGSPIFDAERFAHNFEATIRDLWRNWCARLGSSNLPS